MNAFLTEVSEIATTVWLSLLALILLIKYLSKTPIDKKSSFELTIFVILCLQVLHLYLEYYLGGLFAQPEILENEVKLARLRAAWYLSFAFTDFMAVFVVNQLIKFFELSKNWYTTLFLSCIAFVGFLQIVRYLDRFILLTDNFGGFYSNTIIMVNPIMTVCVLIYTLDVIVKMKFSPRQKEA